MDRTREEQLQALSQKIRRDVIDTLWRAKAGHPGGSLSVVDILATLFFEVMRIDPDAPSWEDRDRLILSKGHATAAYYATLAERGFFSAETLHTYDCLDSCLQGHPDVVTPGVDVPSGSLGQGLSVGLGIALGARLKKKDFRIYVVMGDGELQEGQVWEAAMSAPYFGLDNVTAIIDCNSLQLMGPVDEIMSLEPLAEKWEAFNWHVIEIDGHDVAQIAAACGQAAQTKGGPTAIIARTVKGKGVSIMENQAYWHSGVVTDEVRALALGELGGEGA